jgi:hypothetical protein
MSFRINPLKGTDMSNYVFTLGGFHIYNTMAGDTDTDWVYFTVKAGNKVFGPQHAKIGDLDNGDYVLDWKVGPISINDNDPWLMTYQIVNNGHDDDAAQLAKDQEIASEIGAGVAAVAGAINAFAGTAVAAVVGIIDGVIQLIEGIDCDGVVLSDTVAGPGSLLQSLTSESVFHKETRSYTGPETPFGCGSDAEYTVTWSVTREPAWHGWEDLGGQVTAGPAVASRGVNSLDAFIRGIDNSLYHQSWNGLQWSGWQKLGGTFQDAPAAVSRVQDRIDVFVLGTDQHIGHLAWDGSSWHGWEDMGGSFSSAPAVASWAANRLDLFAKGMDNALYHKAWNGSQWSGWQKLGGTFQDAPAAVSWGPNRIDILVHGNTGHVGHYWWG